jgi:hypothetical protein
LNDPVLRLSGLFFIDYVNKISFYLNSYKHHFLPYHYAFGTYKLENSPFQVAENSPFRIKEKTPFRNRENSPFHISKKTPYRITKNFGFFPELVDYQHHKSYNI